jgi:hypothetical protein
MDMLKKMNLEKVNNILLVVVIALLAGLLLKRVYERFQDTCNASATGVSNIAECNGSNVGEVVESADGRRYQCGQTDGYAFPCL